MSDVTQPFLEKDSKPIFENPTFQPPTIKAKLRNLLGTTQISQYKIVRFPRQTFPYTKTSNRVDNRKTSVITFLPKLLLNEFKQFLNLYFLILCISQIVPALQVGKPLRAAPGPDCKVS